MDKRILELMRSFDESAAQFTQFTQSLRTLKQEFDNLSSELEHVLELAEVEGVSENAKLLQAQLQTVSKEMNEISSLYKELVLANQAAKHEQATTLLKIEKQMRELNQWLNVVSHQNAKTMIQETLSIKTALEQQLISQSQLVAWELTSEHVQEQSQLIKCGDLLWLRHGQSNGLYLITDGTLSLVKTDVESTFWIKDLSVYSLDETKTLTQYHFITKQERIVASNVQDVKLHENTLIYVEDNVIKIK